MTKQLIEQDLWRLLFPVKASASYTNSVSYLKHLTSIGVSIISYMRNIFPEEAYSPFTFSGVHVRVLKENPKCQFANFLAKSVSSSFEALDKKYLHQISLCFYADENEPESLLEAYSFIFSYYDKSSVNIIRKTSSGTSTLYKSTEKQIEDQTRQLIRSCLVMTQGCQDLPEKFDMSIRLYYTYDAPEDYNPEGFTLEQREDHLQKFFKSTLHLGRVTTPYHKLMLHMFNKHLHLDVEEKEKEANSPAAEALNDTQHDLNDDDMEEPVEEEPTTKEISTSLVSEATTEKIKQSYDKSRSMESGNYEIRCPCNLKEAIQNYGSPYFVMCSICNTAQHAVCFDLNKEQLENLIEHYCEICALREGKRCTDQNLTNMSDYTKEKICLYRRALDWCLNLNEMSGLTLNDNFPLSEEKAMKLMRYLEKDNIFSPLPASVKMSLKTVRKIDKNNLTKLLPKYFKSIKILPSETEESHDEDASDQALKSVTEGLMKIFTPTSPKNSNGIDEVTSARRSDSNEENAMEEYDVVPRGKKRSMASNVGENRKRRRAYTTRRVKRGNNKKIE